MYLNSICGWWNGFSPEVTYLKGSLMSALILFVDSI
ncbi:hypothetical protein SAMN06265350_10361 [Solitalea koreensis]|uniref:Uncharacterized protein n=1 Tax=Solitalea koreensis TaxID=543615 RepID=A0A521BYY1_9SPHI|nr:hypothetical protein SAMN06265350_10361 [Solitalea koreensis]